jgi:hypothetical protein
MELRAPLVSVIWKYLMEYLVLNRAKSHDCFRVKKEVINLKPFACLAFPNFTRLQNPKKWLVLVKSW